MKTRKVFIIQVSINMAKTHTVDLRQGDSISRSVEIPKCRIGHKKAHIKRSKNTQYEKVELTKSCQNYLHIPSDT